MTEPVLDRATITEALRRLGEKLAYRGVVADLYVFGGAGMTQAALAYRWSQSEFVRAWEAGAFDHRVELINGGGLAGGDRFLARRYRRPTHRGVATIRSAGDDRDTADRGVSA